MDHTRDSITDHTRDSITDHTRDSITDHTRDSIMDHTDKGRCRAVQRPATKPQREILDPWSA